MMMREGQATAIRRLDYAAPPYWIDTVDLTFDLDPAKTRVLNRMRLRRNPDVPAQPLRLDGEELNLARVQTERAQTAHQYVQALAALLESTGQAGEFERYMAQADIQITPSTP
ncbi:MAG TPA: hypothetical protein DIC45_04275 [Comamonadaceae bacterium]|nr:hypothetical protein [Comamonadaceae bacterium]